ncbi:MAG TPA: tryptophan synthase subunit alpha [Ignavibacteria bacterium]|mgnify:CR=1 FL=1|nr:tryptophan synthase subunit alpha [Ignavibacteria bacterium]
MSMIKNQIQAINDKGDKALSVFLTSGFPNKINFTELALNVFNAGADILEIGIPFSDPIADGAVIQKSSQLALKNGINISATFEYVKEIRKSSAKPILLMGYANPVLAYGIERFAEDSYNSGVNGLIIPDVPVDEQKVFCKNYFNKLDIISLIAPTTPVNRIKMIDEESSGFVYCVSVNGITGKNSDKEINESYLRTIKNTITKNKTLIGFGISSPEDAKKVLPYCDGIIVGSAIIKSLLKEKSPYRETLNLVRELKDSLINCN